MSHEIFVVTDITGVLHAVGILYYDTVVDV